MAIIIHGGAWAIPDLVAEESRQGVSAAARQGYAVLEAGGSALDAVEAAIRVLEDLPIFDAGTGSVLTIKSEVEMDAVIMDGQTLRAGGVACVNNIANPITVARAVMDKTDHTLLVGNGANEFAKECGIKTKWTDELVTEAAKEELRQYLVFSKTVDVCFRHQGSADFQQQNHDTVGAVALDISGNLAFGTSTGGITAKRPGRVGDSPLIGCGGYSDNEVGAVSTTGHGESITKVCLAYRITSNMRQGMDPQTATEEALRYMRNRVQGHGGAVVLDNKGQMGMHFTTERMPWAYVRDGILRSGIDPGTEFTENVHKSV